MHKGTSALLRSTNPPLSCCQHFCCKRFLPPPDPVAASDSHRCPCETLRADEDRQGSTSLAAGPHALGVLRTHLTAGSGAGIAHGSGRVLTDPTSIPPSACWGEEA